MAAAPFLGATVSGVPGNSNDVVIDELAMRSLPLRSLAGCFKLSGAARWNYATDGITLDGRENSKLRISFCSPSDPCPPDARAALMMLYKLERAWMRVTHEWLIDPRDAGHAGLLGTPPECAIHDPSLITDCTTEGLSRPHVEEGNPISLPPRPETHGRCRALSCSVALPITGFSLNLKKPAQKARTHSKFFLHVEFIAPAMGCPVLLGWQSFELSYTRDIVRPTASGAKAEAAAAKAEVAASPAVRVVTEFVPFARWHRHDNTLCNARDERPCSGYCMLAYSAPTPACDVEPEPGQSGGVKLEAGAARLPPRPGTAQCAAHTGVADESAAHHGMHPSTAAGVVQHDHSWGTTARPLAPRSRTRRQRHRGASRGSGDIRGQQSPCEQLQLTHQPPFPPQECLASLQQQQWSPWYQQQQQLQRQYQHLASYHHVGAGAAAAAAAAAAAVAAAAAAASAYTAPATASTSRPIVPQGVGAVPAAARTAGAQCGIGTLPLPLPADTGGAVHHTCGPVVKEEPAAPPGVPPQPAALAWRGTAAVPPACASPQLSLQERDAPSPSLCSGDALNGELPPVGTHAHTHPFGFVQMPGALSPTNTLQLHQPPFARHPHG